jgi:hypothetical protein
MSKGKKAELGTENVSANGYTWVKVPTGWRLKHHLIAEERLGRKIDTKTERVTFADGDRTNFAADNILVGKKNIRVDQTYDRRRQAIEDKVMMFVEEATDKTQALDDMRDVLNEARLAHGFGRI